MLPGNSFVSNPIFAFESRGCCRLKRHSLAHVAGTIRDHRGLAEIIEDGATTAAPPKAVLKHVVELPAGMILLLGNLLGR
jgi:hypothetical protein